MKLSLAGCVLVMLVLAGSPAPAQYVETTVNVGQGPVALAFDSTQARLFVANQNSNSVSVVNTSSNQVVAQVPVGEHPNDIVVNPDVQKAYVSCAPVSGSPGRVYVINTGNNTVIDSPQVGINPTKLVWDRTDNVIFALNRLDPSLSVIDCNSNQVIDQRRLIQVPEDMVWNHVSNKLYVTSGYYMQPGRVYILNAATRESLAVVTSGQDGYRLAFNPEQNRVYSGNKGNRSVTIIDGQTNGVIRTTFGQGEPWAMTWVPAPFNKVVVGNYWNATTSLMRGNEVVLYTTFPGTTNPYCFAYNPRTLKVFAACYLVGRVAVVDLRDGHEDVHDSITVGQGPAAIAIYPDSNRVYVANSWEATVTVLRDYVGIEETENRAAWTARGAQTIARDVLYIPSSPAARHSSLFDLNGRRVMGLVPGPNDVSHLAPGVYFCRSGRGGRDGAFRVVVE
ncbi:YncE family protein [candidate division WOR-3 bacterium]|nr:YncE family protein [candidate division WOR-3 bacterium]